MIAPGRRRLGLLLLGVLLAGCGSSPGAQPSMPDVAPASSAPPAAATPSSSAFGPAQTSPRGLLVKKVGQPAGFSNPGGEVTATFVVDKITVDGRCTGEFAEQPENGHFVILDIRVETTAAMRENDGVQINPMDFSVIGPDGVTESQLSTAAAGQCVDLTDTLQPQRYTPASKYRGKLVLDTAHPAGVLILQPPGGGGWEWTYPA